MLPLLDYVGSTQTATSSFLSQLLVVEKKTFRTDSVRVDVNLWTEVEVLPVPVCVGSTSSFLVVVKKTF